MKIILAHNHYIHTYMLISILICMQINTLTSHKFLVPTQTSEKFIATFTLSPCLVLDTFVAQCKRVVVSCPWVLRKHFNCQLLHSSKKGYIQKDLGKSKQILYRKYLYMPHTVFVWVHECFCIINKYFIHLHICVWICNERFDMAKVGSTVTTTQNLVEGKTFCKQWINWSNHTVS